MVGQFQLNPEVDAAVASLAVSCPHIDRASGTGCRWTGTLLDFDKHQHQHVFDDDQQQQQPAAEEESRGMDDDQADNNDDGQRTPPPSRFAHSGGLRAYDLNHILVERDRLKADMDMTITEQPDEDRNVEMEILPTEVIRFGPIHEMWGYDRMRFYRNGVHFYTSTPIDDTEFRNWLKSQLEAMFPTSEHPQ